MPTSAQELPARAAVVAHDSDGAVELGSTVNAEFTGSSLPGDWDTLLWDPNGSATVGGGQLVLDAARAGTTATYGSGRSLEFAATFAHETFEHVGFGIDFNDAPYAIFSTGNDGSTLKARSGDGNNATDTVLPGNLIGSPHRFRIDWTPSQILFWVDGVQVAIHSATISQMRPLVSDFHHDGTNLTVDWLRMSPFTTSCAFVSRAFDAGAPSAWSTLDAATTTPNGTSVAIDTRTSDDGMSWSAWAPVNGPAITSPVGRYLEYRASLTTTDDAVTPQLTSVHVTAVGMPDPPGIGTAVGGNASVAVAFTAPADHGAPITGYTASCTSSDGGAPGTHTGTAGPISVTGLTNGKTYTCIVTATNAAGTSPPSAASNAVVPATAPGAPTIGTAVHGNTSIAVAFTPPTNNGGSAVTGYTATCTSSDGGTPGTHTGTTSPITVGSLTNGKTYTCTVTAQNTAGTGAPSAASNAVVPATVPGAPTIGTAVRGNTSIAVAFTPPASNGGSAVTGYTAACTSSNGGVTGTRTGTTSPITVGSLTNGKSYTCKVTAQNAVGTGAPSAASNAVVPATVPGAPTIGTVTLAGTTASVPFTAPASNGGSAITGYTATCTSSNGGATKSDLPVDEPDLGARVEPDQDVHVSGVRHQRGRQRRRVGRVERRDRRERARRADDRYRGTRQRIDLRSVHRTGEQRRQCDHRLHRDLHVEQRRYDRRAGGPGEPYLGGRTDQRQVVHVQGDRAERRRHRRALGRVERGRCPPPCPARRPSGRRPRRSARRRWRSPRPRATAAARSRVTPRPARRATAGRRGRTQACRARSP